MRMKQHDKRRAGQAIAVYIEDGQGRRIVIGREERGVVRDAALVATTKAEARHAAAVLRQMADELPDGPAEPSEP